MNNLTKKIPRRRFPAVAGLGLASSLVLGGLFSAEVMAATAANHIIRNTVTVNYDDAAGNAQTAVTDSIDLTVNLVEATPTLTGPVDQSTDPATAVNYSYTITSNANGLDTYNLSQASLVESGGITGSAGAFRDAGDTTNINSIDLGGTTSAEAVTLTALDLDFIVPADSAADGSVNGIGAGDTIVIGGAEFTVASVTDNGGTANATSTITINDPGAGYPTLAIGDLISERRTFLLKVTPGILTSSTDETVTINVNARDDAAAAAATGNDETVTTVSAPSLSVVKYVRNVTSPNGAGTSATINGQTFYSDNNDVNGDPGNTLEYAIVISNTGSSTATNVIISDPIAPFTSYVSNSMQLEETTSGGFNAPAPTDVETDADEGEYDTGTRTVYVFAGSGGASNGTAAAFGGGTGGDIAAGNTSTVLYSVTID